jgi:hypothetical protein
MDGLVQRNRGVDVTNLHDSAGRDQDGGKGYAVNETTIAIGNKDDETTNQPNAGIGKGIKGGDIDGQTSDQESDYPDRDTEESGVEKDSDGDTSVQPNRIETHEVLNARDIHALLRQHEQTMSLVEKDVEMALKDHEQAIPPVEIELRTTSEDCQSIVVQSKETIDWAKKMGDNVRIQGPEDMTDGATTGKIDILALLNVINALKNIVGNEGTSDHSGVNGAQPAVDPIEGGSENSRPESRVDTFEDNRGSIEVTGGHEPRVEPLEDYRESSNVTGGHKNPRRSDVTEVKDNDTKIIEEKCATLIQSVLRMRTIRLRYQSKMNGATVVQSVCATRIQSMFRMRTIRLKYQTQSNDATDDGTETEDGSTEEHGDVTDRYTTGDTRGGDVTGTEDGAMNRKCNGKHKAINAIHAGSIGGVRGPRYDVMSQTVGVDTREPDVSAGGKKDTNVGGSDDVSVCDELKDLERDTKSSVGVNANQQGDEGTRDDVSVGGGDVKGNTINVVHFELDGGAVNGKWSDDAVNAKGVTGEIRCATEERQEGKDAHNGTGDVTVNRPVADVNNRRVSTKPMSQGVGKGDRLEIDNGNADGKQSESLDPDKVNNDATAEDIMNEDERGDVTGVIVIGSEIRNIVMRHII